MLFRLFGFLIKLVGLAAVCAAILAVASFFFMDDLLLDTDEPREADAIVVLGGQLSRPAFAARLFRDGYAPVVLISHPKEREFVPYAQKAGVRIPSENALMRKLLLKEGVPENAIVSYGPEVCSTVEEVDELSRMFATPPDRLLVVTSPTHTRRAKMICEEFFPKTDIRMLATDQEAFPEKWWTDQSVARSVVWELAKTCWYLAGGVFRNDDIQAEPAEAEPASGEG